MTIEFNGENFQVRTFCKKIRSEMQQFEIVQRPGVALMIPVTNEKDIYLVKQYRPAIDGYTIEFPAGKVQKNELLILTAQRELKEELGFETNKITKIGEILTAPHFTDESVTVFLSNGSITKPINPSPKEDIIEIIKTQKSDLMNLIRTGAINDSKTITAFCLYLNFQ